MRRTRGRNAAETLVTRMNVRLLAPSPKAQCHGISSAAVSYSPAPGRTLEITVKDDDGDADPINGEERQ